MSTGGAVKVMAGGYNVQTADLTVDGCLLEGENHIH